VSQMIVKTQELTKQYGHHRAVSSISMRVRKGAVYGLIGRNGAGKTTFLKMLAGLAAPTKGEIELFGRKGRELGAVRSRIGCLIEAPGIYGNMTAYDNLDLKCRFFGIRKKGYIEDILKLIGLSDSGKKKTKNFSLGMKQRLAIALAVMHDPELLILDEPVNGLDPIGIAEVRSFIQALCRERGKTILISSHILSEISLLADDIGIIDHGVLLEEESLAELEQKSSRHIRFFVSDTAQAGRILELRFHEKRFTIQDDHRLIVHNLNLPTGQIVKAFVENGLEVCEAHICEESLEDYFRRVTGGEGIA